MHLRHLSRPVMALLVALVLVLPHNGSAASADAAARWQVGREGLTVDFGDFQSKAELDYPVGRPHAPVVVLIPGSGPEDMNADITGASGRVSHIFLDIADYLAPRGIAVMRYDKHYV